METFKPQEGAYAQRILEKNDGKRDSRSEKNLEWINVARQRHICMAEASLCLCSLTPNFKQYFVLLAWSTVTENGAYAEVATWQLELFTLILFNILHGKRTAWGYVYLHCCGISFEWRGLKSAVAVHYTWAMPCVVMETISIIWKWPSVAVWLALIGLLVCTISLSGRKNCSLKYASFTP